MCVYNTLCSLFAFQFRRRTEQNRSLIGTFHIETQRSGVETLFSNKQDLYDKKVEISKEIRLKKGGIINHFQLFWLVFSFFGQTILLLSQSLYG